jgi:DNA-binding NtrC family response regulator
MDTQFPIDIVEELAKHERRLIVAALEQCGGIKNRAAKLLGIPRPTLVEKMRRLKMPLNKPYRPAVPRSFNSECDEF